MQAADLSAAEISAGLRKILASQTFAEAERLRAFLSFVVERTLAGHADSLKESVIGTAVFRRSAGYDTKTDTVVRAAARRLRLKLEEYYASEGLQDTVRILLTAGTYIPVFLPQVPAAEELLPPAQQMPDSELAAPIPNGRNRSWIASGVLGACNSAPT